MTANIQKNPAWFWIFSIILLVWNIMGIMNFLMQATMTQEDIAALDELQKTLHDNRPTWVMIAFGLAVFGGLAGCIALLLKKKVALSLFLVSLLGVAFQFGHSIVTAPSEAFTAPVLVITTLVIMLAIFAIWFANMSTKKGWIT